MTTGCPGKGKPGHIRLGAKTVFKDNDKIVSLAFPELGVGIVHRVLVRRSKFTNKLYKAVFIKWPKGSITAHIFPMPIGVLDWRLQQHKK